MAIALFQFCSAIGVPRVFISLKIGASCSSFHIVFDIVRDRDGSTLLEGSRQERYLFL